MLDFITVKNNDSASMEPGVTIKTIVVIKQMKVFVAMPVHQISVKEDPLVKKQDLKPSHAAVLRV